MNLQMDMIQKKDFIHPSEFVMRDEDKILVEKLLKESTNF